MASNSDTSQSNKFSPDTRDEFLNEILTCGICLSRMTSPCCLPCAHSFCRSCLLDYAQNPNIHTSTPINAILCPYCKYQVNFRSIEHFESILIINPILKQLCEALDTSKFRPDSANSTTSRARCHSCCLLKMLKVCKHCFFMLCETCRRTHLLDVHRESQMQLELLECRLNLVQEKRNQLDHLARQYDEMREMIRIYTDKSFQYLEEQRDRAMQILEERQHNNEESFWTQNGFDNGEKLDFFLSLVETGKKKLSAKNITDKDLMELSDNLQTIPDVTEKTIQSIRYATLTLQLDQTFTSKPLIEIHEDTSNEQRLSTDPNPAECLNS